MSTLRRLMLILDVVISVTSFKESLSIFSPSLVDKSHTSVKSLSLISPDLLSVMIRILSELRILHIVDVDSRFLPLKILLSNILLINVDFPALVSPKTQIKTEGLING